MAYMHRVYELTITTLSPLHIGTGETLRRGFDYVTHNNRTWRIDSNALAEMLYDEDKSDFDRMVQGAPADQLIRPNEFDPESPLFRYVLQGEPQSSRYGSEVQELLKDSWDRPYIPGSSLKGALRTALAYVGWGQRKLHFNVSDLGGSKKFAAQPLEQMVLNIDPIPRGKAPNYDLLRALQVSDSSPDAGQQMWLTNVNVATKRKLGSPIELEAVAMQVTFTATLTLDGFLAGDASGELGWQDDQLLWLKNIPQVVNKFSGPRIAAEAKFWGQTDYRIKSFYGTLARIATQEINPKREFLLQLGWGGGWSSKTLNDHLTKDKDAFDTVVKRYRLDRQKSHRKGDPFPKSRRVVVQNGAPVLPLGWVRVGMERIE